MSPEDLKRSTDNPAIHETDSHSPDSVLFSRRSFLSVVVPGSFPPARPRSQRQPADMAERFRRMSEDAERKGLAEPFKGITANGTVVPGLFPIHSTGVSTEPVRNAAERFIASLT